MKVKKISAANVEACSLPKLFDEEKIDFQPIQCVNWAEYPYKPKVNFRIAHTQNSILLHFKVKEESVRAKYGEDNGSVWTDSCVEFFSIPAGDGIYYNIECNCIGTILVGAGPVRTTANMHRKRWLLLYNAGLVWVISLLLNASVKRTGKWPLLFRILCSFSTRLIRSTERR